MRSVLRSPLFVRLFTQYSHFSEKQYHGRTSNVGKRAVMLSKLITNKDTKKNWHLNLMSNPSKQKNIFEKVHKPARRSAVLNALFIRNITDLLSTGDIAPEVMGYGIEITGVKVTMDYQIVNVFWQIPPNKFDNSVNIQKILSVRAPQIRAELISRNILGRVPKIFFVRDTTNEKLAEFEKALLSADLGPEDEEKIVPDEKFLKNIYSFSSKKEKKASRESEEVHETKAPESNNLLVAPQNPSNMKSDILGLNHDSLLKRVLVAKKKTTVESTDISPVPHQENEGSDLFTRISGTYLQTDINREKVLKQFYVERKMLMKEKKRCLTFTDTESELYSQEVSTNSLDDSNYESDYFEEENVNNDEKFL